VSFQINIPDHILFEDEYLLVINKPCGLMVEPDRNGHPNLLQQVKKYIQLSKSKGEEVYAQHIHRLDRPVSGVILFTKQKAVLKNLSEQFAERSVKKYYEALTENAPLQHEGVLEHWHQKLKKKAVITNEKKSEWSEKAILNYSVKEILQNKFLWTIELHTGKFHQIRAQLASVGCPIIGDKYYGSTASYKADAIALHACKLVFHHPISNQEIVIDSKSDF
jgi:RluA family pseudouridine synthase